MDKQSLGQLGEDITTKYLRRRRYKIVERNHWQKWGELDIIAIASDKTLVLVEVKTVSGPNPQITGEDQMTSGKTERFKRAAQIYASGQGQTLVGERGWRMDVVTVIIDNDRATIRHYENI